MAITVEFSETRYVTPTPQELAKEFCLMTADERAQFFDEIGKISKGWNAPFCKAVDRMVESEYFTRDASNVMRALWDRNVYFKDE